MAYSYLWSILIWLVLAPVDDAWEDKIGLLDRGFAGALQDTVAETVRVASYSCTLDAANILHRSSLPDNR